MKIIKYKGTAGGLIVVFIWGLVYLLGLLVPGMLFLPLLTLITVVPLEYLSSAIFGNNNYPLESIGVLIGEILILVVLYIWYLRKMIRAQRQGIEFKVKELIVFFTFLQFVLHPVGWYICILMEYISLPEDSVFLLSNLAESMPYTVLLCIPIGMIIDLIQYRISIKNSN